MTTVTIDVPDDLLALLGQSRLATRPQADRITLALAIQLCQEGVISVGKAAELAGESRWDFEQLLVEMGLPVVRYDEFEAGRDRRNWAAWQRRRLP